MPLVKKDKKDPEVKEDLTKQDLERFNKLSKLDREISLVIAEGDIARGKF